MDIETFKQILKNESVFCTFQYEGIIFFERDDEKYSFIQIKSQEKFTVHVASQDYNFQSKFNYLDTFEFALKNYNFYIYKLCLLF